ncbi:MAG: hypothetical protein AAF959_21760 [Cyanobacteria bacterium P01_D01_bin.56]
MKNSFNISPSQDAALCSLCEDTLLRHIRQSRVYWYCPSCRQEMVCEEAHVPQTKPAIAAQLSPIPQPHKRTRVTEHSQPVSVRTSP